MPRPRFSLILSFFRYLAFWKKRKALDGSSGTLILLLGSSRSGRSHFINVARGEDPTQHPARAPSHKDLTSEPDTQVQCFALDSRPGTPLSSPVILAEIPGFDNHWADDAQIIQELYAWLQNNCAKDVKLGGILYFYDTYSERLNRTPLDQPPQVVPALLGDRQLARRFSLVTSKWDKLCDTCSISVEDEGRKLEDTSLCRILKMSQSSQDPEQDPHHIAHFRNNPESAWKAINQLLRLPPVRLKSLKSILGTVLNTLAKSTPSTTPRPDATHATPPGSATEASHSPAPITTGQGAIPRSRSNRSGRGGNALPRQSVTGRESTKLPSQVVILDPNPVPSRFRFPGSAPVIARPASVHSPVQFPALKPLSESLSTMGNTASEVSGEVQQPEEDSEPRISGVSTSTVAWFQASPSASVTIPVSAPSISASRQSVRSLNTLGHSPADAVVPEDPDLDGTTPTQEPPWEPSPPPSSTTELGIQSSLATPVGRSQPEQDSLLRIPSLSARPSSPDLTISSSVSKYSQDTQPLAPSPSRTVQIQDTDVIIMVMGLEGSGKSTFVNALLPEYSPKMQVGEPDSLLPCTTNVEHRVLGVEALGDVFGVHKDYRLVLVDTVGLHAPDKPDSQILSEIATWSRDVLPKGGCRGGIIFLDNLSGLRRIRDSDILALEGHFGMATATTKWSLLGEEEAQVYHDAISARRANSSVKAAIRGFKESRDAQDIVNDLLAEVELEPRVDVSAVFDTLAARKAKKEKERESVWDTLRSSLSG